MKNHKSVELYEEAKKYFPGGVNSPVRAFKSVFGTPLFIEKGDGARIFDADGNSYIDYCCSWGPLILGHNHPEVRKAIIQAVENGTSFGAPTIPENKLAKLIIENNRFIEKLRFVSSGTEAVMSAIRLARGATKRNKILKFEGCYHGHVDALLVKAGSGLITFGESTSAGIPDAYSKETLVLSLNDTEALEKLFKEYGDDIAAAIIEPIPANNGLLLQDKSFLEYLRKICTQYGSLLIFDEVISGFRIGFEGAAGYYDIYPDIITYGKIIGGGMPVGAYGASAELMKNISPDGAVYQAGTLSGNPVAMSAGFATLSILLESNFYEELNTKTNYLAARLNDYATQKGYAVSFPHIGSIFWIAFDKKRIQQAEEIDPATMQHFKILHRELLERGIYLGPSGYEVGFVSAAHTYPDLDHTIHLFKESLDRVFQ